MASLCAQEADFQLEFTEAARRLWLQINQVRLLNLHTILPISVCRQGKPWHFTEHARQRLCILQ